MNTTDNNDSAISDNTDRPVLTVSAEDKLPALVRERRKWRRSVTPPESTIQNREILTTAREDAAGLREDAAGLREDAAGLREDAAGLREDAAGLKENFALKREEKVASREREVLVSEAVQAASDEHMLMLQQANERLVITTIQAQELADQVKTATAQLEHAKAMAEKANLAKSDFLSSMSHELRTPLNAILGFAQLLESGTPAPTDAQTVRLQQIIKAGWYLLELINEVLDLATIESGKLSLSREPVTLIHVIRECESMIESQAQQHGITLDFVAFDLAWQASADEIRLKQVLINLLSNAIKYNRPQGTVTVTCSISEADQMRISVTDTGMGLSPEKLAQLFQPFNRLGQESSSEEGTGIGLVVTKQLVALMGGTMGVNSKVGIGSEFWIELDRGIVPQLTHDQVTAAEPFVNLRKTNVTPRTLLYVEDNAANLMLVEHIIEDHPHLRLLSAHNSDVGLDLARTHLPDIILMDVSLPGISGVEVMHILRDDPATTHIPVVALSANAIPRDIEIGMDAGFFCYLTKPLKINDFMNAVNNALRYSARAQHSTHESLPIP